MREVRERIIEYSNYAVNVSTIGGNIGSIYDKYQGDLKTQR